MNNNTDKAFDARWQEITNIWQSYLLEYRLLVIVVLIVAGLWVFGQNGLNMAGDMLGYVTNVFTESLSIIVTVLVLDRLNKKRATEAHKTELLEQVHSRSNELAHDALRQLKNKDWLNDLPKDNLWNVQWQGVTVFHHQDLSEAKLGDGANLQQANLSSTNLKNAFLTNANLQEANLYGANLQRANLENANLKESNLDRTKLQHAHLRNANLQDTFINHANLREADLFAANMQGANLDYADLREAYLVSVNLQQADLRYADLREANLGEVDLRGAVNIEFAKYNEKTMLPDDENRFQRDVDGTIKRDDKGMFLHEPTIYWTPETDMTRYTNPDHPDFWMPKWAAAGFSHAIEWYNPGELTPYRHSPGRAYPWRDAGYGDDHMAWVRAGNQDYQAKHTAAGFTTHREWLDAGYRDLQYEGKPHPWREAGYGNDHMAWVRAGKPAPLTKGDLYYEDRYEWLAAGFATKRKWFDADIPHPWEDAGYGKNDFMAWVRAGKPDKKPEK